MTTMPIDEKREILEQVLEKMDECAELLRSLGDTRIEAYCLAAFEGSNGGWIGKHERDILEDEFAALDGAGNDEECAR